jgi:hypothetical protein
MLWYPSRRRVSVFIRLKDRGFQSSSVILPPSAGSMKTFRSSELVMISSCPSWSKSPFSTASQALVSAFFAEALGRTTGPCVRSCLSARHSAWIRCS